MDTSPLRVRPPAVAGLFYPGDPDTLAAAVDHDLSAADLAIAEGTSARRPKAVIAPHAGYRYSGPIAASAYRAFDAVRSDVRRVILIGPSHRYPLDGLAVSTADVFETPLGDAKVDTGARDALLELDLVEAIDAAHAAEHSLEVHIPFIQRVFPDAEILPIVVGAANPADVARVLERVWGGDETVIVASSDLSHYHDYETARGLDRRTAARIEAGDVEAIDSLDACGAGGVRGLLYKIRDEDRVVRCVDLRNSGDTAGDRDRVVGYGAFVVS